MIYELQVYVFLFHTSVSLVLDALCGAMLLVIGNVTMRDDGGTGLRSKSPNPSMHLLSQMMCTVHIVVLLQMVKLNFTAVFPVV